jgi:hypothetical protein
MDGDNILQFPLPKTAVDSRTVEITLLADDIAELLHGGGGALDLSELLILLEAASGKLYEMGSLLVEDRGEKERLKIYFSSIRILVAAAHKRVEEMKRQELR